MTAIEKILKHAENEGRKDYQGRAAAVATGEEAPAWAWPFNGADEAYLDAVPLSQICREAGVKEAAIDWEEIASEWCAAFRRGYESANAAATLGRKGGQASTPAKQSTARENGAKGGRPRYTIEMPVKVGIYDSEYVARVYADKIIVTVPTVRWVGNTGGYAESKEAIRDQAVIAAVTADLADDCETSAWRKIGNAINNDYLMRD